MSEGNQDERYQEEQALSQTQEDQMYASLGRSLYMVMDPKVIKQINADPFLKHMAPAFSHLNRLTKYGPKQAEILELDFEALLLIVKICSNEDEFEETRWQTIQALQIFYPGIIHDSFKGFKADIVTNQLKTIRTELEKKKKSRWPW